MQAAKQQIDAIKASLETMDYSDIRPSVLAAFAGLSVADAKALAAEYLPGVVFRSGRKAAECVAHMLEETAFTLMRCNF